MDKHSEGILLIDVGGTYTKYAVWLDSKFIYTNKVKTHLNDRQLFTKVQSDTIKQISKDYKITKVNVSSTGIIDPNGLVTDANKNGQEYIGFNWKEFIYSLFNKNIFGYALNDAKAFANYVLKETNTSSFICLTIGTGVGMTAVINKKIIQGNNNLSGEIGSLYWKESMTIDDYFSAKRFHDEIIKTTNDKNFSFKHFNKYIKEPIIEKYFNDWCSEFAKLITFLVAIIDPKEIYISGGISYIGSSLVDNIYKYLNDLVPIQFDAKKIIIKITKEKNDANLLGVL